MTVHRLPAQIPAVSAVEVERPRLDGSLHRLSAGEVRCVCLWAAAGAGKTTLLADWARRLRRAGESVTWWSGQELGSFRPGDFWRRAGQGAPVAEMPGDGDPVRVHR